MRTFWSRTGLAIIALAISAQAHSQGAVQQSGPIVPFHSSAWFGNGVVADAGTPAAPYVSNFGLFNGANCPLGVSSQTGPGVSLSPYAQFLVCQTNTATTLYFQGVNGQAAPSVFFNIGGVSYPFPGGGIGNVVGPASAVIGHLACFNSTAGTLLADCGAGLPISLTSQVTGILPQANGGSGASTLGAGTVTTANTAAARTLASHFADHLTVLDETAKCDGSTDDSAAFAAAITAARANFPSSTVIDVPASAVGCVIASTVTLPGGVILAGKGIGLSHILAGSANMTMFSLQGTGNGIRDIEINAGFSGAPTSGAAIVLAANSISDFVRNVEVDAACIALDVNGSSGAFDSLSLGFAGTNCYGVRQGHLTTFAASTDNYYNNVNSVSSQSSVGSANFLFLDGGGTFVSHSNASFGAIGTYIDPGGSQQFIWGTFDDSYLGDNNTTTGLQIDTASSSAVVKGNQFENIWVASSAGNGLIINNTSSGVVDGNHFIGLRNYGNASDGAFLTGGLNTTIDASSFCGNGAGNANISVYSGVSYFAVRNTRIGGACDGFSTTPAYAILFNGSGTNITVTGNNLVGPTTAIGVAPSGNNLFANNQGVDDVTTTLASAATITTTANSQYILTGNTSITVINGPTWNNRHVQFFDQNLAAFTTAGSGICNAVTPATTNATVEATFIAAASCWALK